MIAPTEAILTEAEAIAYTKQISPRAFRRWRSKYGVPAVGRQRFAKHKLDLAIDRQAGAARMPATLRRKTS